MATVNQITSSVEGISCHAWNADRSQVALCPNNNEIHIYSTVTQPWSRLFVLTEHDLLVSAIDWCPINNKIVSCAHDRNAFVWTYEPESTVNTGGGVVVTPATWRPVLVILRIDRAALDVKWSMDGLRFAVTSGAKCVPVCTYDPMNDWWVSKMIKKKFKSTVLCCAFHPTNAQLLATGCADFKCRVFSTFSTDVDGNEVNAGPFGSPLEFGEAYTEISALGWINAVAWSPSGSVLAFAGHDSSIHFATLYPDGPVVQTIRFSFLPLNKLVFLQEKTIIGAGHDFNPVIFSYSKKGWGYVDFVQKKENEVKQTASDGVAAARAMFKSKSVKGQDSKPDTDTLWTKHESAITGLTIVSPNNQEPTIISTSALDGRIVVWDLPLLDVDVGSMSI